MALTLRMSVDGQLQLSRTLLIASQAVQDWTPAFEQTAEDLVEFFSYDVFESEGEAIDDPWAALSPAYEARKAKKYPGKGILEATGTMREFFVSDVTSMSLTISNTAEYYKYHQSPLPRTKLPRRVMMKLTEPLKQIVIKNFQSYYLQCLGQ